VDGLRQVTFHFVSDAEIRYLPNAPEAGEYVVHHGLLWRVSQVTTDPVGVTVICESPTDDGHDVDEPA
jgi:hypothetical protein